MGTEKNMKLLVIISICCLLDLVAGTSCTHPGFLIPRIEKYATLRIHENVEVEISCTFSEIMGRPVKMNDKINKINCFVNETIVGSYDLDSDITENTVPSKNLTFEVNKDFTLPRNNYNLYLNVSFEIVAVFENAFVYRLRDSSNFVLDYALFTKDGSDDESFMVRFSYENPNTDNERVFYKTNMENTTICFCSFEKEFDEVRVLCDYDLTHLFVPKALSFYQMWLECKLNNRGTPDDVSLDYIPNKYFIFIWSFLLWIIIKFSISLVVNFTTLWRLKPLKQNNKKYLWCCVNEALCVSNVCKSFRDGHQMIRQQLYELLNILQNDENVLHYPQHGG